MAALPSYTNGEYTQPALAFVGAAVVLLHLHAVTLRVVWRVAVAGIVWTGVSAVFSYDDAVLACAAMLALPALRKAYVSARTLVVTNPLQIVFPFVSKVLTKYTFTEEEFYRADGCSEALAQKRKAALAELAAHWQKKWPKSLQFAESLKETISDVRFISGRCFPPFNKVMGETIDPSTILGDTDGVDLIDVDGHRLMDISGSYGVNVIGYNRYKEMIQKGWDMSKTQGMVLGPFSPVVLENIRMLQRVSGKPEVSFHMSGTEAVMAAVRLARFNTGREQIVAFTGSYHGWWDGVQPDAGNERVPGDVLSLKDLSRGSLDVIRLRSSGIAAVLINPLQSFHANQKPPSDLVLQTNNRSVGEDAGYGRYLKELRALCSETGISLIFDEVYTGFRLVAGGAQEYYGVDADIVVYGKTLGGGLPTGVVCGPTHLMQRSDPTKTARVAYVIGTFAAHPVVMGTMNAFLTWVTTEAAKAEYTTLNARVRDFCARTNEEMKAAGFPIQVDNFCSIWSILYTQPGRYHWMLQYYMKDAGINLSWVGTGRLLFSLDWTEANFAELRARMLRACRAMLDGGWWEVPRGNIKRMLAVENLTAIAKGIFAAPPAHAARRVPAMQTSPVMAPAPYTSG